MIRKIMKYNLLHIPDDLLSLLGTARGEIVFLSIIYLVGIFAIAYGVVMSIKFDWRLTFILYVFTIALNGLILHKWNLLLYLNRHPRSTFTIILFIFTGPFGLIKAGYLAVCLKLMVKRAQFKIITEEPQHVWHPLIQHNRSSFIHSLAKYQQRLKDYS